LSDIPRAGPHTTAVLAALVAAGVKADLGKVPDGASWQGTPGTSSFVGYAVIYPFPGSLDGDLCDPYEYLEYRFQATCVGATSTQAERVIDDVRATLVGRRLLVVGRSCYPVDQVPLDRPIVRDDAVAPPLHFGVIQLFFRSQPA
jgi:hypothetical protein